MTNHSLTPELVLQQTTSHFMRLEDEMKQTRSMVDEWSFKQDEEVQLIVREHRNLTQGYKSMFYFVCTCIQLENLTQTICYFKQRQCNSYLNSMKDWRDK